MATSEIKQVKCVLIGDSGVGKSSIIVRFVHDEFSSESETTLGASFFQKQVTVRGQLIKYQIWDTAGQEKYHSLAPMYYRDAEVAIFVYDISSRASFVTLKRWVNELKQNGPQNIIMVIVGNKTDLEEQEEVEFKVAADYAKELNAIFRQTSAKENKGIQELFNSVAEQYLDYQEKLKKDNTRRVTLSKDVVTKPNENKKNCC